MRIQKLVAVILLFASQALWADGQVPNKYAVVFDSIPLESPVYKQHIQEQAASLIKLWDKGIVENIYLNHEVDKPKQNREASIVFFIKADNKDEANKTLQKLPFVQHDVLNYELHPVGVLWLKQIEDHPEARKR